MGSTGNYMNEVLITVIITWTTSRSGWRSCCGECVKPILQLACPNSLQWTWNRKVLRCSNVNSPREVLPIVTQVNLLTSRLPLPCVISTGVGWWDARKLLIQLLDLGVIQRQGFVLLAFALSLGEVEGRFWAVLVGISWDWVWADLHTTSWPQLHWRAGLDANKGGSQDVVFFFFFPL